MKNKKRQKKSEACIRRLYLNRIFPLFKKKYGTKQFKRFANWHTLKEFQFIFILKENRPFAIFRHQYIWLTHKIFIRLFWTKKGYRYIYGRKKNN